MYRTRVLTLLHPRQRHTYGLTSALPLCFRSLRLADLG